MYTTHIKTLPSRRESAIKEQITRSKTVTPKEYCDKWVTKKSGLQPDEWGYASACVRELAKVLGCSEITVRGWGKDFSKYPDYVTVNLSNVDKLNAIAEILEPKN
jgi:hypothetical protein